MAWTSSNTEKFTETAVAYATPSVLQYDDRACNGIPDAEIFYPKHVHDSGAAIRLCGTCPYERECLGWAIRTQQEYGIWGGVTAPGRRRLRRAHRLP